MTREEAIRILDPETTAEALAEIEYYNGFSGKTAKVQAVSEACEIAVADMRAKQSAIERCNHGKNQTAVVQTDMVTGKEIRYSSMTEAARATGIPISQISAACIHDRQCHGFFWRKEEG